MARQKNFSRTIGVFYGSRSVEHDNSVATAKALIPALLGMGYNVVSVYQTPDNQWFIKRHEDSDSIDLVPDSYQSSAAEDWRLHLNQPRVLRFSRPGTFSNLKIDIDIVFPVFHGLSAEDGTLQGLCDLLGVQYIGCSLTAAALAQDKVLAKDILRTFNLPTMNHVYFTSNEWTDYQEKLIEAVEQSLGYPVYCKPARLGGSVAVAHVSNSEDLVQAVETAIERDDKVLIERAAQNPIDIKVAVTGNYYRPDQIQVSRPVVTSEITNAVVQKLTTKMMKGIQEVARQCFVSFEGTGIMQIDFVMESAGLDYYVIEIDPMPHRLAFGLWEQSGITPDQLIRELVRLSDENHDKLTN